MQTLAVVFVLDALQERNRVCHGAADFKALGHQTYWAIRVGGGVGIHICNCVAGALPSAPTPRETPPTLVKEGWVISPHPLQLDFLNSWVAAISFNVADRFDQICVNLATTVPSTEPHRPRLVCHPTQICQRQMGLLPLTDLHWERAINSCARHTTAILRPRLRSMSPC